VCVCVSARERERERARLTHTCLTAFGAAKRPLDAPSLPLSSAVRHVCVCASAITYTHALFLFPSLSGLFRDYYVREYYADLGFESGLLHSGILRSGLLRSG
jgi:hypothetical protein